MVAVRVSLDHRPAIAGSPAYFVEHPKPSSPHDCCSIGASTTGPLITNDVGLLMRAALDGVGLAFMSDEQAALSAFIQTLRLHE